MTAVTTVMNMRRGAATGGTPQKKMSKMSDQGTENNSAPVAA